MGSIGFIIIGVIVAAVVCFACISSSKSTDIKPTAETESKPEKKVITQAEWGTLDMNAISKALPPNGRDYKAYKEQVEKMNMVTLEFEYKKLYTMKGMQLSSTAKKKDCLKCLEIATAEINNRIPNMLNQWETEVKANIGNRENNKKTPDRSYKSSLKSTSSYSHNPYTNTASTHTGYSDSAYGNTTESSNKKNASVVGRAIAGGMVAGPVGAIVGAISAADKNNRNKNS